jgi:hypothetical protein
MHSTTTDASSRGRFTAHPCWFFRGRYCLALVEDERTFRTPNASVPKLRIALTTTRRRMDGSTTATHPLLPENMNGDPHSADTERVTRGLACLTHVSRVHCSLTQGLMSATGRHLRD